MQRLSGRYARLLRDILAVVLGLAAGYGIYSLLHIEVIHELVSEQIQLNEVREMIIGGVMAVLFILTFRSILSGSELNEEIRSGWALAYSPTAIYQRLIRTRNRPFFERLIVFVANLCFRGVFFPQMNFKAWTRLFFENRKSFIEIFFRSRLWTRRAHLKPMVLPSISVVPDAKAETVP